MSLDYYENIVKSIRENGDVSYSLSHYRKKQGQTVEAGRTCSNTSAQVTGHNLYFHVCLSVWHNKFKVAIIAAEVGFIFNTRTCPNSIQTEPVKRL